MASLVCAYSPGPASLTAATRNSYGLPSVSPFTVTLLSDTSSPGVALHTRQNQQPSNLIVIFHSSRLAQISTLNIICLFSPSPDSLRLVSVVRMITRTIEAENIRPKTSLSAPPFLIIQSYLPVGNTWFLGATRVCLLQNGILIISVVSAGLTVVRNTPTHALCKDNCSKH